MSTVAVLRMNLGESALLILWSVKEFERAAPPGSADLPLVPRGREAERENAEFSGREREFGCGCVGLPGVDLGSAGRLSSLPGTCNMCPLSLAARALKRWSFLGLREAIVGG